MDRPEGINRFENANHYERPTSMFSDDSEFQLPDSTTNDDDKIINIEETIDYFEYQRVNEENPEVQQANRENPRFQQANDVEEEINHENLDLLLNHNRVRLHKVMLELSINDSPPIRYQSSSMNISLQDMDLMEIEMDPERRASDNQPHVQQHQEEPPQENSRRTPEANENLLPPIPAEDGYPAVHQELPDNHDNSENAPPMNCQPLPYNYEAHFNNGNYSPGHNNAPSNCNAPTYDHHVHMEGARNLSNYHPEDSQNLHSGNYHAQESTNQQPLYSPYQFHRDHQPNSTMPWSYPLSDENLLMIRSMVQQIQNSMMHHNAYSAESIRQPAEPLIRNHGNEEYMEFEARNQIPTHENYVEPRPQIYPENRSFAGNSSVSSAELYEDRSNEAERGSYGYGEPPLMLNNFNNEAFRQHHFENFRQEDEFFEEEIEPQLEPIDYSIRSFNSRNEMN